MKSLRSYPRSSLSLQFKRSCASPLNHPQPPPDPVPLFPFCVLQDKRKRIDRDPFRRSKIPWKREKERRVDPSSLKGGDLCLISARSL